MASRRTAPCCAGLLLLMLALLGRSALGQPHDADVQALDFQPAPRSSLVSAAEGAWLVARRAEGLAQQTVLAWQSAGARPQPVARWWQRSSGASPTVEVQLAPVAAAAGWPELARLEQLYALLLRLDPLARYCLEPGPLACGNADGHSHAQLLLQLVWLREQARVRWPQTAQWQDVDLQPVPAPVADPDVVAVQAWVQGRPLEGVTIHFNRAPHSLCAARTQADGLAWCRLQDQHGDGQQHEHATAVVATFPGDRQAGRVLPPITQVLEGRPSFASLPAEAGWRPGRRP